MPASDEEIEYFVGEILSRAARRGVFREDLLNHRPSTLSKTDAARAIRIAKERGLYAVPDMSHPAYGTWYQCDDASRKEP